MLRGLAKGEARRGTAPFSGCAGDPEGAAGPGSEVIAGAVVLARGLLSWRGVPSCLSNPRPERNTVDKQDARRKRETRQNEKKMRVPNLRGFQDAPKSLEHDREEMEKCLRSGVGCLDGAIKLFFENLGCVQLPRSCRLVAITNGNAQTDDIPCLKEFFEFCVLAEQVGALTSDP